MQVTKIQKLRINYIKGKNLSLADMLDRSSTQEELQLNHLKQNQLLPQVHFAALTHDTQLKLVFFG